MPDPTSSSAPTTTSDKAVSSPPAAGSVANGGAAPGGDAKTQGTGATPDGAAPGTPAGSGGQSPAVTETPKADEKKGVELKPPEGWQDEKALIEFKKAAEESGLDSPKAQRFFDLFAAREKAEADALAAAQSEWLQAAKADKEIGGASFDANSLLAKKAMVKFGGESLQTWLQETGLGNHPELIRAFVRIGKAMAEDSIAGKGNGVTTAANDEQTALRKLYPNSPEMFES